MKLDERCLPMPCLMLYLDARRRAGVYLRPGKPSCFKNMGELKGAAEHHALISCAHRERAARAEAAGRGSLYHEAYHKSQYSIEKC